MVKVLVGDLFSSKAQTLVNTINCVGVMGKGIARKFKERFPEMNLDYVARCKRGEVRLGRPYLYRRLYEPWVLNFPTKDHWRSVSRLQDIEAGLRHLAEHYRSWGITSLAVPPLGCGNGQLDWRVIGPTLYRHLCDLEIPVELYAPFGTPENELSEAFLSEEVSVEEMQRFTSGHAIEPAWFALVALLARIEREPYHPPIGRTSFQKLAYFATESGLPTGLHFEKRSFGPFSADLKKQITRLQNNGLIREERSGRMYRICVGPAYRDALKVFRPALEAWADKLRNLLDLFLRMDTTQAEIAATVHFAVHHLLETPETATEEDVLEVVREWKKKRRPSLDEARVAESIRYLNMTGWIEVGFSSNLIEDEWLAEAVA
jgi:O-acetyl-ADP-ribose deacetylase (regulator of RNase III)/uncharacterized protein YwgA